MHTRAGWTMCLVLAASGLAQSSWVRRPHLPAFVDFGMASDPVRGRLVVFGGFGLNGLQGETWEWNGSSWGNRLLQVHLIEAKLLGNQHKLCQERN